jgi:hypothetical protein
MVCFGLAADCTSVASSTAAVGPLIIQSCACSWALTQQFSIQNLTLQKGGENKARHAFC